LLYGAYDSRIFLWYIKKDTDDLLAGKGVPFPYINSLTEHFIGWGFPEEAHARSFTRLTLNIELSADDFGTFAHIL
jgi:hypothetical protein